MSHHVFGALLLAACTPPGSGTLGPSPEPVPTASDPGTVPSEPVTSVPDPAGRGWTIAVWLDGDNNLETYVLNDLDELERMAAADGVSVVVQADRKPGGSAGDGDWTGTRRYEMVGNSEPGVQSPVLEDLGEVNMGDGQELADFLVWTEERYPADRIAVVLWNHGGGFWIASDDSSDGDRIGLDDGELTDALAPLVALRGAPIDVIGFDACNMAEWEVAHTLRGQATVLAASQAWVGGGGLAYDRVFDELDAGADARAVGDRLAYGAGVINDELTFSAVDLASTEAVSDAVDALAGAYLDAPAGVADFLRARDAARGVDRLWEDWFMDLGEIADRSAESADPAVVAAALDLRAAVDASVLSAYNRETVGFASGLTIYADTSSDAYTTRYATGPWAEGRWDDLVLLATE